ncbi:MAG: hypothetical protein PHZ00_01315 [Candidatus Peribacteraceae bacterium]|nr:hypothetical protein [Candidatus Peribacteraceae bacterium]
MLTPREIIAQAWTITTTEPALKRWGFFGTFFRLLLDIKLIAYQIYFLVALLHQKEVGLFDDAIWLYDKVSFGMFVTIVVLFLLLLLVEIFVPSMTDGPIIGLTAKSYKREPVQGGFILGLYNFFPIFTVHELFVFSGVNLLITAVSILMRYGAGLTPFLIVIAVLLWIMSSVLKFLSSFAEPAIVIDKIGIFQSVSKSIKLVFSYPQHVIFLIILLIMITIRVFVNTILIVLIPGAAFGLGIVLTYVFTPVISYSVAGVAGLVMIFVMAYYFTYLHVFKQTVWTLMYMELKGQKEMDVIG